MLKRLYQNRNPRVIRMIIVQISVLLIVVMMSWGKRMGTSLMSPLKSTLKHELNINNTRWASVISMVWVVGTLSPFIAGMLIDIVGAPLAGAIAIVLILIGNGVCAIAVGNSKVHIFLLGRAIYSMGGGAVFLVGEVIMLKWFKGRQLPLAFGVASTVGGLMAFSGPAVVTTILSKNANVTIPFWIATGLTAFGLLCFGVYGIIHHSHYAEEIEAMDDEYNIVANKHNTMITQSSMVDKKQQNYKDRQMVIVPNQESGVLEAKRQTTIRSIASPSSSSATSLVSASFLKSDPARRKLPTFAAIGAKCKKIFFGLASLPECYWHVLLCISVQGTLFIPLSEVVPEMMENEWGYTKASASRLFVYLHIIPIVLHLSIGIFINRMGHRLTIFLVGSVLVFFASVFISYIRCVPIILSLVMINLSGSMVPASIFSMMNLVIDNGEIAGAALGLIRSAEFASVTLMEMLDGLLQDKAQNRYDTVLIGLVTFAAFLLLIAVASIAVDYFRHNGIMNNADPYKLQPGSQYSFPGMGQEDDTFVNNELTEPKYIPKRRYVYIGVICVLLATAWILFIISLTRI